MTKQIRISPSGARLPLALQVAFVLSDANMLGSTTFTAGAAQKPLEHMTPIAYAKRAGVRSDHVVAMASGATVGPTGNLSLVIEGRFTPETTGVPGSWFSAGVVAQSGGQDTRTMSTQTLQQPNLAAGLVEYRLAGFSINEDGVIFLAAASLSVVSYRL